jgi:hypothetical protein
MSIERNAPCPCGSGIKYKKCCWLTTRPAPGLLDRRRLIIRMMEWAAEKFRPQVIEAWQQLTAAFTSDEVDHFMHAMDSSSSAPSVLSVDYFCYRFLHEYRGVRATFIQHFLAHSGPMASDERALFERLSKSTLQVFRVISVALDSIEMVDLIARNGPRIRVFCSAMNFLPQDRIIARLIDVNDRIEFAMVLQLLVFDTKDVQSNFKDVLKADPAHVALTSIQTGKPIRGRGQDEARKIADFIASSPEALAALPEDLERLKARVLERSLYQLWLEDLLLTLPSANAMPSMIFAGTGEALELHEDDYDILDHAALLEILRKQSDVSMPLDDAPTSATRLELVDGKIPSSGRPLSMINFDGARKLSLFHPSKGRHTQGKAWFENIAGSTVRYRQTRVTIPGESLSSAPNVTSIATGASSKSTLDQAALMQSPEVQNVLLGRIKQQYATWTTDRIPALNNKTPTQLMTSRAGRDQVRALLLSYQQAQKIPGTIDLKFDYQFLWDELGLSRVE